LYIIFISNLFVRIYYLLVELISNWPAKVQKSFLMPKYFQPKANQRANQRGLFEPNAHARRRIIYCDAMEKKLEGVKDISLTLRRKERKEL